MPNPLQNERDAPLLKRLWQYQKERFPVFRTGILVAFFTAATLIVSAGLAGRELPPFWNFIAIWASVFLLFFQMRVFDEIKDFEIDAKYRPERAVPRGLVSLALLKRLSLFAALLIVAFTISISVQNLWPLAIVWLWLFLMSFEFFAPNWLKARPFVYLFSHMAIMPLIDFYVSAGEWMAHDAAPPKALAFFLALSFLNGCVLEFGRKIWSPESEREGVETYSKLLGFARASKIWTGFVAAALILLLAVAFALGSLIWVAVPAVLGAGYILKLAMNFRANPNPANAQKIDNASGVWVILCYGLAGLPPLVSLAMA